jgi:HSP20 family protein
MLDRMMDNDWPAVEPDVIVPVDVKAEEDAFVLTALLPGVKAEDLNIQIVNETVSIQGQLYDDRDESSQYLLAERPSGKFSRTLTLPAAMDSNKAEAELKDGVLKLRIPKADEARPKTIKIVSK